MNYKKTLKIALMAGLLCSTQGIVHAAGGAPNINQVHQAIAQALDIVGNAHAQARAGINAVQMAAADTINDKVAQAQAALDLELNNRRDDAAAIYKANTDECETARLLANQAKEDARQALEDAKAEAIKAKDAADNTLEMIADAQAAFDAKVADIDTKLEDKKAELEQQMQDALAAAHEKFTEQAKAAAISEAEEIEKARSAAKIELREKELELEKKAAEEQADAVERAKSAAQLEHHEKQIALDKAMQLELQEKAAEENVKLQKQKIDADAAENKKKLKAEKEAVAAKIAADQKLKDDELEQAAKLHADKLVADKELKVLDNAANLEQLKNKLEFGKESLASIGNGFKNLTDDPKRMARMGGAVAGTALLIYTAKYGLPHLFDYLVQPQVVSETSKRSLFGWKAPIEEASLNELTFTPELQSSLNEITMQLKTAKEHGEALPNILFAGPPGTGKTAFAKALAREKDAQGNKLFDYALTSGSEFAKIKDLNIATGELRKLIRWAKKSSKPMIVFIDEAESLFSDRTLPETPKSATDFINAFLSMVQDKSQKNICFIFATNHMFKLDSAIFNRVGKPIEFTVPGALETSKILATYVTKFAKANENSMVHVSKEFISNIPTYVQELNGCVPRDIRFIAEEMVVKARRTSAKSITHEVAQRAITEGRRTLAIKDKLEKEKAVWMQQKVAAVRS